MPRTEEQLLDIVYARSTEITRRRRMRTLGIAVASAAAVAMLVFTVLPDVGQRDAIVDPAGPQVTAKATDAPDKIRTPRPGRAVLPRVEPFATPAPTQRPAPDGGSKPEDASCDPLISDEMGDTKDRRLDIRTGSITYTGSRLDFVYRVRDLTGMYSTTESVSWDLSFSFGGNRYIARAIHGTEPMGGSEAFKILRGDESEVVDVIGSIDDDTDLISIYMNVDDFNAVESTRLRDGSVLNDLEMRTGTSKLAANDTDTASSSCDFTLR